MRNFRESVWFTLIALIFVALSITAFIVIFIIMLALRFNVIAFTLPFRAITITLFVIVVILLGTLIASLSGKVIVSPIKKLIHGIRRVSHGDFSVQVECDTRTEISELITEFNKMVRELGNIETLRNDFVANVSHEFKTPIAAIEGCATLLQDKNLSPEERLEYTQLISESAHRLSVLTTNILQLSKLENQEIVPELKEFSLDEQLRQAILLLENQWSEKSIDLDIDLDPVTVFASEELLMQVWTNLIGNAIKFSHNGGSITISLKSTDKKYFVSIKDTGIGMSPETIEHIFDKFYQGDTSHSGKGNGLGLPLANRIVTIFGGNMFVKSALGQGSEFVVELPKTSRPLPSKKD